MSLKSQGTIKVGMVGLGMIFDETYRPFFEVVANRGLFQRSTGLVEVELTGVATRTGIRSDRYRESAPTGLRNFASFTGADAVERLVASGVNAVCVATPDDRHFDAAFTALSAGKHVLIEKPSVLTLGELDRLL